MIPEFKLPREKSFGQRTQKAAAQWNLLINELNEKEVPKDIEEQIVNVSTEFLKPTTDKKIRRKIKGGIHKVIQLVSTKLKWVPKGHYQNMWLALGMTAFGLPLGMAFSAALDNYAFLGIGLPIGLAIGLSIGNQKDKKAKNEGRQLSFKPSI